MAKTNFRSVDEYLRTKPAGQRAVLSQVRSAIRKALPKAEEVISYQIPAYRVDGRVALFFAGWSEHYSLYPVGEKLMTAFGDELAGYEQSKGTLRFPMDQKVPTRLIQRIAKFKAQEAAERASATGQKRKPNSKPRTGTRAKTTRK